MRDVERLREKHEFSLDDRQIAALAFCALLVVSATFALGLMLGRNSGAPPPAAPDLSAMDEAAKRPAPMQAAVIPLKATPPAAPPAEVADEEAAPEQGKPPDSIPPPAAALQRAASKTQADAPHATVPAAQRAPMVVPPPPRPVQLAAKNPTVGGAGFAGDGRSPQGGASIDFTPPPKEVGRFTVQVGASQDRLEVKRLEQRIRAAGLKPYVVEADLGPKGVWYRLRVGAFADKDSAGRFQKDVERELRSPAVVMPTH